MTSIALKLQRRLRTEESGFTLIELLIVLVIIGVLLAIAVPSYLGFKDRAEKKAASSNVRASIPAAEAYYSDHGNYQFTLLPDGTASGTTLLALQAIDQGIGEAGWTIVGGASTYCLQNAQGTHFAAVTGPGGDVRDESQAGYAAC